MAFVPDPSLEAGLAALKQGDYKIAIAHLEGVSIVEMEPNTILRAKMGLVAAYERNGDVEKAVAICQQLGQSANPQVKEWAIRTLAGLGDRSNPTADNSKSSVKKPPTSNSTGFVPLDPIAKTPQTTNSSTGFVPLDPIAKTPQTNSRPTVTPISGVSTPKTPQTNSRPTVPPKSGVSTSKTPQEVQKRGEAKENPQTSSDAIHRVSTTDKGNRVSTTDAMNRVSTSAHEWRQAGRMQRGQSLPLTVGFKPEAIQLWVVQVLTAIALFWLLRLILPYFTSLINYWLVKLPYLEPIQALNQFYYDPTWPLLIGLVILLGTSPWLIYGLLKLFYNLKPLSEQTLTTYSPEAVKLLQRIGRERRLPLPSLGLLPIDAPVAIAYGNLPHTAKIIVSQGLLEQLADDEIATIYATQIGHIVRWDLALMSLGVLLVQLPYTIYWQVSQWGERWEGWVMRFTSAAIASLAYGLYWLLRWPFVWLSRLRVYYSDRFATEIAGNPNGLTRALLKIAIGVAKDIEKQGQTSWLLEGFDLLTPLGHQQAMTLGSLYPHTRFEPILAWDWLNPHRRWLTLNNFHPLIGDRLQLLARYARHWKLETELDFNPDSDAMNRVSTTGNSTLLLQGAPYFGMAIGLAFGGLLWLISGVSILLRFRPLDWMWGDRSLLFGCLLMGASFGILSRINSFFPDITPSTQLSDPSLPELLANRAALPVDRLPVRLQGKLLGRRGIGNWLGQDLILQLNPGLVKLHFLSWLGPLGNLLVRSNRPGDLVTRAIAATGWFRRGATTWLDLETLQTQTGKTSQSGHPIWSTILALALAIWGFYIIMRGGR